MNQIHAPERVKAIRDSAAAYLRSVTDLEARMQDPYFRGRLQQIRFGLEDIESFFLGALTRESRTPVQESTWLDYTDIALAIVVRQLKVIQDAVAKFGVNVATAGSGS
jgi:hypothetical protein